MPGPLVHLGATITCVHAGQATPMAPNPRVLVSGQPVVTLASPYAIAGCPYPSTNGGPCVTAQFVVGATRVFVMGQPVLVQSSQAVCAPTGTPVLILVTQPRVVGM